MKPFRLPPRIFSALPASPWPCRCSSAFCRRATPPRAGRRAAAAWSHEHDPRHLRGQSLPHDRRAATSSARRISISLKDFRSDLTLFSGVSHPGGGWRACERGGLPHRRAASRRQSLPQYHLAGSIRRGEVWRRDALSPRLSTASVSGGSLSVNARGVQLPADNKPSEVFSGSSSRARPRKSDQQVARLKEGRASWTWFSTQTKRLQRGLGQRDRERLDQYFTSVREVEQRMVKAEEWTNKPKPHVDAKPPEDIADAKDIIGRTRLLFDLVHLALQTDSTRLVTCLLMGHNSVPPIQGVTHRWHNLSHHGKDPRSSINSRSSRLAQLFALRDLLAKLKATAEPGGSLLDHTSVLFGSNLGNAASHDTRNMPIMLFGGGFKHAGHLAFDNRTTRPSRRSLSRCSSAWPRDGPVFEQHRNAKGSRTSGVTKPAGIDGHDGRR